ncbi:MAG: TolC family protein [Deltaproteobacteria bacterium]|nr:TolC family protein [Deltaproteobacteria bacterium]
MSLEKAIDMALAYSPTLAQAQDRRDQADQAKRESITYFLPSFSTGYNYQRQQSSPTISTPFGDFSTVDKNTYVWNTRVEQPVFTGFRILSNYRLAALGVDVAEANIITSLLDVVLSVKEAYFDHLSALKGLDVAQQSVKLLESQLKTSKDFHEVGILPINDVLKVEVELANSQQALVSAENRVSLTLSTLDRVMGLDVNYDLKIVDILKYTPVDLTLERALNTARTTRPELKAISLQLDQADQQIKAAQSDYYPQIGVQGDYDFQGDSPDLGGSDTLDASNWSVSAQVRWNFWQWGRTRSQVGQRRAAKMQLTEAQRDLQDQIDLQVKQAYLYLRDAEKNIGTSQTAIRSAEENYRITGERYREQLTTNTELLDAQTLLTQSRNNYLTTLSVYNVALARLRRAMGQGIPAGASPTPGAQATPTAAAPRVTPVAAMTPASPAAPATPAATAGR